MLYRRPLRVHPRIIDPTDHDSNYFLHPCLPKTETKMLGVSLIGLAWTAGFAAPGQRENLKVGLSDRGVRSPVSL